MANKSMLFVLAAALLAGANALRCSDHLLSLKADDFNAEDGASYDATMCTASFSSFEKHLPHVHTLINEHLTQSFLYSIMASHFETDMENRLGFAKYMDKLADDMWSDSVELIKYAGKRGYGIAPTDSAAGLKVADLNVGIKPWTEVEALALALDNHQGLAGKVHQLHNSVKDAALGDFLEDQFVKDHVDRIRQLSGHLSNLVPMVQDPASKDLALYLYDQSLA